MESKFSESRKKEPPNRTLESSDEMFPLSGYNENVEIFVSAVLMVRSPFF